MSEPLDVSAPIARGELVSGFSAQRSIFQPRPTSSPPTNSGTGIGSIGRRSSAFCEVGLGGEDSMVDEKMQRESIPLLHVLEGQQDSVTKPETSPTKLSENATTNSTIRPAWISPTMLFIVCAAVLLWPSFLSVASKSRMAPVVANAIQSERVASMAQIRHSPLLSRQDSATVCKRWAHMSAVVNGTLYVYGGQATSDPSQTQNTWTNNFLTLDLTKTWQIGSPSLTSATRPSSLPAVALGALWQDNNNLYLYGGEFSSKPATAPVANSLWQYVIASKSWQEQKNPEDVNGQAVERAAEGAGVSIPYLGRGFYLGGHLDGYTVPDWSQSIPRVYLQSTLEYTMPNFANTALKQSPAGSGGAYRNLTADSAGFPQRADGALVYVPGYSDSGIIIALAGGTVDTFSQMNVIDVYDVAGSKWYRQATTGPTPKIRVNPCAVALSAPDGSSTQIYMYGGQNLQPAANQTQYDDLWILTIPSFTWIEVDQSQQSTPPARAGHTCNVWNGQMIVVGGYVSQELSCDSPGIYVFNTSSLTWQTQYSYLDTKDPLNRQLSQANDPTALQGSNGYLVPAVVQEKIGGNEEGAATVTAPAQFATAGPLVSGKPRTYSATGTAGPGATSTGGSGGGMNHGGGATGGGNGGGGTNAGAIAAGVVAGLLAILAAYLGFCAWVYRRQLKLYKNHLAMMQRESLANDPSRHLAGIGAFAAVPGSGHGRYSDKDQTSENLRPVSLDNHSGHSLGVNTAATSNSGEGGRSHVDSARRQDLGSNNPYRGVPGGTGYATANSSTDDLLRGQEPSFLGVVLNPRRSLRVVNKD